MAPNRKQRRTIADVQRVHGSGYCKTAQTYLPQKDGRLSWPRWPVTRRPQTVTNLLTR